MKPRLLIVVLNYQATHVTVDCLRSLSSCGILHRGEARVVVWENGTGVEAVSVLREAIEANQMCDWTELLVSVDNLGFTGGNNRVIQRALHSDNRPDYFLLLNSDTLVTDESLTNLIDFMDRHPRAGVGGSQLLSETGEIQGSPFRFPSIASEFDSGLRFGLVSRLLSSRSVIMPTPKEETQVDWVAGASMILRRQMLEQIGLLDEGFFTYFEDMDLCKRAHQNGWEVWYVPQSRVIHLEGASSGIVRTVIKRRPSFWFQARRRYYLKHAGEFRSGCIDAAYILGFSLWRLRRFIQQRPDNDPPQMLLDFIRHSVFLKGFQVKDVQKPSIQTTIVSGRGPDKFDIMYVEGPGDVVDSFRRWDKQEDVISETSRTFSGQFFDFCKAEGLRAYAISYCNDQKQEYTSQFRVENRPKRILGSGIFYHLSQILYGLSIVVTAIRYRPYYINITSGVTYWFVLSPLKLFGIKIVPHFHNSLWPSGFRPKRLSQGTLLALDGWFLRHVARASLCVSPEISRQIYELAGTSQVVVNQFRAQFYRRDFENPPSPPQHGQKPFIAIFAGRVERNKGVFDLLDMAEQLRGEGVVFEICGIGSDLDKLKESCIQRALSDVVQIHGKLRRPELLAVYARAHTVIVPTRSDFCEGLPLVAAEAVLMGRPVITSRLSNAMDVLVGAIAEAQPDDVGSYVDVIRRLLYDQVYYEASCRSCSALREQFLDGEQGLTSVLINTWRNWK